LQILDQAVVGDMPPIEQNNFNDIMYFIMVFMVLFQTNHLSILAVETLFKFFNVILVIFNIQSSFPAKFNTIKAIVKSDYAHRGTKNFATIFVDQIK
jgi:hypothetical protein